MSTEPPDDEQPPAEKPTRPAGDGWLRAGAPPPSPPPQHRRYVAREVLGKGGQGIVWRVHDRELGRDVAMKTLLPEKISMEVVELFLREAQATAVLEHPNIVPIYDVGKLDDGRPFYTMRLVPGRSFLNVLQGLRNDELEGREDADWSLVRLLQVVQQACLALQFAHERGVVHRDVKPANLMLGSHGEVLLVDWGIAKVTGPGMQSTTGSVKGTMHYMSPEQARGERVDARTDVYAMGVLLYESLSLRLPFEETSQGELMAAILRDEPPGVERRTHRIVPPELAEICRRAMMKKREERLQTAREMHDALQAFVEGVAEKARRLREAERLSGEGHELLARHEATLRELAEAREQLEALTKVHPSWQPLEEKKPLLDAQRRIEDLERRSRTELLQSVHRLTDALAHAPEHAQARAQLADTFLDRLREAERERDDAMSEVWLSLVERYHDGRHARELGGRGSVRVRMEPSHARWVMHRLVEEGIALVDGPIVYEGRGDIVLDDVEMGSYVVVAQGEGREPARYPIAIFRNTEWEGELKLLPEGSIPEGFVYIPGTWTWLGGDPKAVNGLPLRRAWVDSFLIARYPVTFREWCEFLDSLPEQEALKRIPRTESLGPLCERREGRFEPTVLARTLGAWTKALHGDECAWQVPVMGVCLEDAHAHAAFAGTRAGVGIRLLSSEQWEVAARGVDRRAFPWGERFDATACHARERAPRQPDVAPIGSAVLDQSVYGVRDMAGGMLTLTATDLRAGSSPTEVRGGSWQAPAVLCRSASRQIATATTRTAHVGIRLAAELGS